jgi:acyl carrier protein
VNPTSADRKVLERELLSIARVVMHKDVIDTNQSLFEQGLTSVGALDIRSQIEKRLGVSLVSNLVFDYPTVSALGHFLADREQSVSEMAVGSVSIDGAGSRKSLIEEEAIREILKRNFGV